MVAPTFEIFILPFEELTRRHDDIIIKGNFIDWLTLDIMEFEGFIRADLSEGRFFDYYGRSAITKIVITDKEVRFQKKYERGYSVFYQYKRIDLNIYRGIYNLNGFQGVTMISLNHSSIIINAF